MNWREHIVCNPSILCGKPTLKGTRLSVEFVLDLLAAGYSRIDIERDYPNLTQERLCAVLAYAADSARRQFRDTRSQIKHQTKVLRFKRGTDLKNVPDLVFMLRLMGCQEALLSALRWRGHTEGETEFANSLDNIMSQQAGAAWCAVAFRLLKEGKATSVLNPRMLDGSDSSLHVFWNRISDTAQDAVIRKIHTIRDKYFAHFDADIMQKFVAWQVRMGATEPFFLCDEAFAVEESRFLWPLAAFIFDLFPDPSDPDRPQKCEALMDELCAIWSQTVNLIAAFVDSWILTNGHYFEVAEGDNV